MKRSLTTAALSVLLAVAALPATMAAESPAAHRYRVVREPSQSTLVRITKSGSTSFSGTNAQGETVTVIFLSRFATVERDGKRVPVSYLRPGDEVEVSGKMKGHRIAASSARVAQPRTAAGE